MDWLAYVLGGLPGALLAVAAGTGLVSERTALYLFAPSFIVLNLAHMAAAWDQAYRPGWRAATVERAVIPALLVLGSLALEAKGFGALLLTAQYWLSLHHATMQNYGILRSLRRTTSPRLEQAACVLLPLGALAWRARAVCDRYDGATLLLPPAWLAPLLAIAGIIALSTFALRERGLARWFVVGTTLLWTGLLVGLSHPALPLYALASGHYVQHLYFVYRRQERSPLSYLTVTALAGGGVAAILTLATLGARAWTGSTSTIPPWVAAMIGVNLWHYWIESRIWRRRSVSRSADMVVAKM